MKKNYYLTLNINKSATKKEIIKAYRKLALKWHPDKNNSPDAESNFKEIAEAYEILSDEKLKPAFEKGNLSTCWKETVGPLINENTTIKSFKKGLLIIKTKTPVWRNELLFQKNDIIQKLNFKLEKNKIKDIRFL